MAVLETGIVIVGECEKEYARTHNGSTSGMYSMPADTTSAKTGTATGLYATGWAVMAVTLFTATMLL